MVDLHDIFADYFAETDGATYDQQQQQQPQQQQLAANLQQELAANAAAAGAQTQQQQQQLPLPTGQGIKTAWHSGGLPAMLQQQDGGQQQQAGEPPAKRSRGEDLFFPTGQQQQQHQQHNYVTQQQLALAQAASGVGGLSSRLGFAQNNNMGGSNNFIQQQQQQQQQQQVAQTGGINLPIGMGVKFGAGGAVINHQQQSTSGITFNGNTMMNTTAAAMLAANPLLMASIAHQPNSLLSNMSAPLPMNKHAVEEQMAEERRLRNREHAKRSRVRKKFMLESLQQQVRGLQDENSTLRLLVQQHMPHDALKIIDECCSKSVLFGIGEGSDAAGGQPQDKKEDNETPLLRSDFSLISSLTSGQQNFVLSDPRLPDNPIVFASQGFYDLTGYTRDQILGRNCRFLQGAGTDRKAIDVIRTAVANGTDATVCLLNYKADGTAFWNQLFVAALRDADNCIVNYVGVQTMVEPNAGASALEEKVDAAHPITVGRDDCEGEGDVK